MITLRLAPSFVDRLGWVLLHSIWEFALIAIAAMLGARLMRNCSSLARYGFLLAALAFVIVAPLATWVALALRMTASRPGAATESTNAQVIIPARLLEGTNEPRSIEGGARFAPTAAHQIVAASSPSDSSTWRERVEKTLSPWLRIVVWIWGIGVALFALRPLVSWATLRRLRSVGVRAASGPLQATFMDTMRKLRMARAVEILESTAIQVPVALGYLRPAILIPAGAIAGLSPFQVEAILAHELAHIRRHDFLVNLLQTLVETICFYHPAVWWLSARIREERENCCDDVAIRVTGDRVELGRALLALEEFRGSALALGATGGALRDRVRRLFFETPRRSSGGAPLAAVAALVVIAAAVWAGSSSDSNNNSSKNAADQATNSSKDTSDPEKAAMRRIYLDLLERLPSGQERSQFETSTAPDKLKELIDRLIDSDERWSVWSRRWREYVEGQNVDDRTFVRRIYLDALGLPVTEEQIRSFIDDADPQKRFKLAEELFQSKDARERQRIWIRALYLGDAAAVRSTAAAGEASRKEDIKAKEKKEGADWVIPRNPWRAFGRVVDGDGKPVEGAEIIAHCGMGTLKATGRAKSGADGTYTLDFDRGIWMKLPSPQTKIASITVRKLGYVEKNMSQHGACIASLEPVDDKLAKDWGSSPDRVILPGKPHKIDFVLVAAAKVSGTLIDEQDRPLADYSVALTGEKLPPSSSVLVSATTDANGRFLLEPIGTNFEFQFTVRRPNPKPPWDDSWASAPFIFEHPGERDFVAKTYRERISARQFRIKLIGPGVHERTAVAESSKTKRVELHGKSELVPRNGALAERNADELNLILRNASAKEKAEPAKPKNVEPEKAKALLPGDTVVSAVVVDAASGAPIAKFRALAAVPYTGGKEPVPTWQPHTIREFTDGNLTWPIKNAYDTMMLRIEADGYQSETTEWVKKKDGGKAYRIDLERDPGVELTVKTPDGKPAVGAAVAIGLSNRTIGLRGKTIVGANEPRPQKLSDAWRRAFVGRTDERGMIKLPTETDPTALLCIVHETGYFDRDCAGYAVVEGKPVRSRTVGLERWGRIEGRVLWRDKPGAGASIVCLHTRDAGGYPVIESGSQTVNSDDEGRFVFEDLPPGRVQITRLSPSKDAQNPHWHAHIHPVVKAGATTEVIVGGRGRPLVGKLVGLESYDGITVRITPNTPRPGDRESLAAWGEFAQSEVGKLYFTSPVAVNADGTFQLDGVLPEYYQLFIASADRSVFSVQRVSVPPEVPGEELKPFSAGEFTLKRRTQ